MRRFFPFLLALLAIAQSVTAQETDPPAALTELIREFPSGTQFAAAVVVGDSVTYHGLSLEKDSVRSVVNHDHTFAIGSVTKVFTSLLLARAVRGGRVGLDDYVGDYYDFPWHDTTRITFRQLANHTSGLPRLPTNMLGDAMAYPNNPYVNYTPERLEDFLRTGLTVGTPGSYQYSNFGAGLLAYTLARRVFRTTLDTSYRRWVLDSLDMSATAVGPDTLSPTSVVGLNSTGAPTAHWEFTDALGGAGALFSTAADLAKLVRAQFGENEILALARRPTADIGKRGAVALGWHIIRQPAGDTLHWHNGGVGGFRSMVVVDVANRRGLVLLTNVSAFHPASGRIDAVALDLLP